MADECNQKEVGGVYGEAGASILIFVKLLPLRKGRTAIKRRPQPPFIRETSVTE
jgi:hypothetical protein